MAARLLIPAFALRMDFRDPNIVGTFVYHCHLLEHEDKGMMGSIRVDPASPPASENNASTPCDTHDDSAAPCKKFRRRQKLASK